MLLTRVFSLLPPCRAFVLLCIFLAAVGTATAQPPGPADTIRSSNGIAICPGTSTQLSLNLATNPPNPNYIWEFANAATGPWQPITPINTTPTITVSTAQWYKVSLLINNVKTVYDSIQIIQLPKTTPDFTFSPAGSCASVPVYFTNTTPGSGNTYTWSFGDPNSGGNNSSTATNPSHRFVGTVGNSTENFAVKLVVTNSNGCKDSITQVVTINQEPDASIADFADDKPFKNCDGSLFKLEIDNISTTKSTNTFYRIDWGDGTPQFANATLPNTGTSHVYTSLGSFNLVLSVTGQNGCIASKTYPIYNGSNPGVPFEFKGETVGFCAPFSISIPSLPTNNTSGTIYVFSKNDGSVDDILQNPPPANYSHTFTKTSCGASGGITPNTFFINIRAQNPCGFSDVTIQPIATDQKPKAQVTVAPDTLVCTNSNVSFTNNSTNGITVSNEGICNTTTKSNWSISPSSGWNLDNGVLGDANPTNNPATWGSKSINVRFTQSGIFFITLIVGNKCGNDTITKKICVQTPPVAQITGTATTICAPNSISFSDASVDPAICKAATRTWIITKSNSICPPDSANDYTFINGTNSNSANPQVRFNNQGVYTVQLRLTNSCGNFLSNSITVRVNKKPTVSLTLPPIICQGSTVTPNLLATNCASTPLTYSWTINGGTPSTSSFQNPGPIQFLSPGVFNISVEINSECGPITISRTITVNPAPDVTVPANVVVCAGQTVGPFTFNSTLAGTSFTWANNNNSIGLAGNGIGNIGSFTAINNSTTAVTATVTVRPVNTCNGPTQSFTITVNPRPLAPVVSNLNYCVGDAASPLTATALNGHSLNWYTVATGGTALGTAPIPTTSAPGTFTWWVSQTNSANGCEGPRSSITVTVRMVPVITITSSNPTTCGSSTGSITINGLTPLTSYTVSYTRNGAPVSTNTSSDASGRIVLNLLNAAVYDQIRVATGGFCPSLPQGPISLNDPNPPAVPVAANNGPVCAGNNLNLTASSATTGVTYNWSGPAGFSSNQQNPVISNIQLNRAGTYSVTASLNGCVSAAASTSVVINPTPVLTATANSPVCVNGSIQLNGTVIPAGGIVVWSGPNGFNATGLNASIANASLAASGTYTLTSSLNGCPATPVTVNLLVRPTPVINNTVVAQPTSCTIADGSITLQGLTAATSYQVNYTFNGTPQSRNIAANASGHVVISGLAPGNYTNIRVTLNGCVSNNANDVTLVAPNPPPTPVAANNGPVCTGSNLQLSATSTATGITYSWTGPNGFSSNQQNPVLSNVTTNNAGIYTVTITQNGCVSAPATTSVVIQAAVSNNTIAANQSICINTTPAQLTGSTPAGGGGTIVYAWEMSTDGGSSWQTIPGANSINYQPGVLTQTTRYRRIVTTSLCAGPQSSNSNVITVTVNPNALAVLNANQTLGCAPFILTPNNISVQHFATRNGSYRWYVNNVLIGSSQSFPGYTISGSGQSVTIKIVAQSLFGCLSDSATVDISTFAGPTPSFTLSDTVGCGPLDITINNTTANSSAFTYRWDFGNGQTSTAAQPGTIRFAINPNRGDTVYTVTLKATAGCDTIVATQKIRVRARPRALFTPDKSIGCSPMTVTFNNNSAGSNASFIWDFGDGSPRISSNAPSLSHTFTTGVLDTFFVRLFASNDCGTDTATFAIVVNPNRIRLDMAVNGNELFGCVQHTVRFINNTTGANRFVWNFGDGSPILTSTKGFDTIMHVYTQPGTYTVTLDASNGCSDTSTTETITVVQGPTVSFTAMPAQICIGDSVSITNTSTESLAWAWSFGDGSSSSLRNPGKHVYTQAGNYRIVLRGTKIFPQGFGCTDSAVANIQVQAPTGSFQYRSGYYCQNQSIQLEVFNSNGNRYIFYPGNGDSIISNASSVSYRFTSPGRYIPSVKVFAGNCTILLPGTDTVFVDRIIQGFRFTIDQSCGSTTVRFADTSSVFLGRAQISWRFGDGTTANTATVNKTFLQAGTYRVVMRITGISGCEDSAVQVIDVPFQPLPSIAIQGDSAACIGQAFTLSAQTNTAGTIAFNWNFGNNQQANGSTVSTSYLSAGNATIRLIGRTDFGCADTVYKTIRINPTPVVVASNDAKICLGQSTTLQVRGANSYTWSPQQSLSCNNCSSTVASPTQTTAYVVTGNNAFGCSNTDTVLVTVVQPFQISVSPNDTICFPQNESAQLFANGAKRYVWSPAVGLNASNIPNPIARPASTTAYTVIGYDDDNCFTDTAFVTVAVGYLPTLELGTGSMVVAGTAVTLNPIITNGPIKWYTWTPNKDLSCNNCPNPVATINNNILYRLNIENIYGCLATDTISYQVQCKQNEQVYVPNAFSPDGDGVNDVLMVRGKGLSMVKSFIIFNRWGQVVFEAQNFAANDPTAGWNGIMKNTGKKAAQDVYVYRVETICTAGGTFTQTGNVTLFYMQ